MRTAELADQMQAVLEALEPYLADEPDGDGFEGWGSLTVDLPFELLRQFAAALKAARGEA
jgi:hypothetical protein